MSIEIYLGERVNYQQESRRIMREVGADSRKTREELLAIQRQRFKALAAHVVKHSAYYREVTGGKDPDKLELHDFPVLTKKIMMERFDEVVTTPDLKLAEINAFLEDESQFCEMYKGRYMPLRTSGTTGESAVMVVDPLESFHYQAAQRGRSPYKVNLPVILKFLLGRITGPWRIASLVTLKGKVSSGYVAGRTLEKMMGGPNAGLLVNRWFNLLDPIDSLVAQLNEFQPNAIGGPASILHTLANEQLEGRLRLNLNLPINRVFTGGEPLLPATVKAVQDAWGCHITNNYGATECGVIACSMELGGGLRHMLDLSILEVVDKDGNPVPTGQTGDKVLVTNLLNFVQPIIRYELSDVVGFAEDDGHGFPLMLPIVGRRDDLFLLEEENGKAHVLRPGGFVVFNEISAIRQSQVVQTGRNQFEVRYALFDQYADQDETVRQRLRDSLATFDFPVSADWQLVRVTSFPRMANGKFRQFWNQYRQNADAVAEAP